MNGNVFGVPWKSIIGFLTVFGGQLLARATVAGVTVLPGNASGWVSLIGGSAVAAGVIWLKSNSYTIPQLDAKRAAAGRSDGKTAP